MTAQGPSPLSVSGKEVTYHQGAPGGCALDKGECSVLHGVGGRVLNSCKVFTESSIHPVGDVCPVRLQDGRNIKF